MKPAPFAYHRPASLDEALDLLGSLGDDAKVLAGGQSLVPLLALRLAAPAHLIDIAGLPGLGTIAATDHGYRIGAGVTQRAAELDPTLTREVPLLADALPLIAHPQIRNRGTVCGSLAHADPAAELPSVACALDATLHVASTRGTRQIAAADFFRSYLETALAPDEILVAVELPRAAARQGAAFCEVSRRHGDFGVAGAAVVLSLAPDGRIASLQMALSGVASVPVRTPEAAALAVGSEMSDELVAAIAHAATAGLDPPDDVHATAAYRRHVAGVLVRRALHDAHHRATIGAPQ